MPARYIGAMVSSNGNVLGTIHDEDRPQIVSLVLVNDEDEPGFDIMTDDLPAVIDLLSETLRKLRSEG